MPRLMEPLAWDITADFSRTRHEQVNHALCMMAYVLPPRFVNGDVGVNCLSDHVPNHTPLALCIHLGW
jgi:hypothetical protein